MRRIWLAALAASVLATSTAAEVVRLKSGATVEGTVLKRTDRAVWVDLGPDVVQFMVDDILDIEGGSVSGPTVTVSESLFHTAVNPPERSPREYAKILGPAVIKVSTPSGLGSGVIINEEGYAITNAHVIQGETNLKATVWFPLPDGTFQRTVISDIEIIAVNSHIDLALIKIEHPHGKPFEYAPLATDKPVEVGQTVFAIGNPLGLERTLSQGVVSTTTRSFDGLTYVQIDAAINPGNSGGPLFNTNGEVIGITNMGYNFSQGLNFAIPSRYVKDFVRNREAFAFDKDNPNSGHNYHQAPPRERFDVSPLLNDDTGK
ncbi:MAG: trypsin-like peptidase domain-containing protein [Phycisphaerales bacterium]|nr:trypsin-like peptidase domain-containing protein [Phycisphaerales bacterium]